MSDIILINYEENPMSEKLSSEISKNNPVSQKSKSSLKNSAIEKAKDDEGDRFEKAIKSILLSLQNSYFINTDRSKLVIKNKEVLKNYNLIQEYAEFFLFISKLEDKVSCK